ERRLERRGLQLGVDAHDHRHAAALGDDGGRGVGRRRGVGVDHVGPGDVRSDTTEQRMGEARLRGAQAPGRKPLYRYARGRLAGVRLVAADDPQLMAASQKGRDVTFTGPGLTTEAWVDVVSDEQNSQ